MHCLKHRPANIMWRDVASQIISISSNSSSSSSSSSIVGSVEIQIIDFEDAVPFGRCIKHATSYRRHCSYPDFGSQTEYIVAEARHNNFFFNAISAWLLESETIVEFRDFMYKLDSESRSRFSIAPQVLSSEMPVQIEGVSGSNSQVKRKFDHEG